VTHTCFCTRATTPSCVVLAGAICWLACTEDLAFRARTVAGEHLVNLDRLAEQVALMQAPTRGSLHFPVNYLITCLQFRDPMKQDENLIE